MAGNRLTQRVAALEGGTEGTWRGPAVWIIQEVGETRESALARYEAQHGSLEGLNTLIWCVTTGVPRGEGSICA